jgi:hypothetical protein
VGALQPAAVERFLNTEHLEDVLSEPTGEAVDAMARMEGDLIILGAAGKMGPTLARMARRASERAGVRRRIIGVARFSDPRQEEKLRAHGVETLRCDLLDPAQVARLPEVPNVFYLVGTKFGTTGQEPRTWAVNCWLPGLVCQKFRGARIAAFSTGNVYGLSPLWRGGSMENDPLNPVGDYAMSCVGRERLFEHFSQAYQTPMLLLRLNYATEVRYGVLVDLALMVRDGQPIDLTMGNFNTIWQGDACALALACFRFATLPALPLNVSGPETLSVRRVAEELGSLLNHPPTFHGSEGPDALLTNVEQVHRLFGFPRVTTGRMIAWIGDWLTRGGVTFDKPTHFQVRDGHF